MLFPGATDCTTMRLYSTNDSELCVFPPPVQTVARAASLSNAIDQSVEHNYITLKHAELYDEARSSICKPFLPSKWVRGILLC